MTPEQFFKKAIKFGEWMERNEIEYFWNEKGELTFFETDKSDGFVHEFTAEKAMKRLNEFIEK